MKILAMILGCLSLLGTIVPAALFMVHQIELEPVKVVMMVSCVTWFLSAPFWMKTDGS